MCTECQRPAAVGVQCVDCVNAGRAQQRANAPRTAVGAAPLAGQPIVTYTLMGIAGAVYLLQMIGLDGVLAQMLVFAPFRALGMPWTFVTSGFLHGSLVHVGLNLYALWAVGQYLERTLGHWRYTLLFLLSVIGGHASVLLLAAPYSESWFVGTVGASGGVFGLFGALLIVQRRMGGQAAQVLVLIAINFVISFIYPNISWQGHLGGLVVGGALAYLLFHFRPKATPGADRTALAKKAATWHGAVFAGMGVLLIVLIAVKVLLAMMAGAPVLIPF